MMNQTPCRPKSWAHRLRRGGTRYGAYAVIGVAIWSAGGCQSTRCCDDATGNKGFLGVSSYCDPCAEIPDGAVPPPPGTRVEQWRCAQANAAEQDKLVIYHYEFLCDSAELSPFGHRHVKEVAALTSTMAGPVIVQPSDDAELDRDRRTAVSQKLATMGVIDADERVVLAFPKAEGLYGIETQPVLWGFSGGGRGGQAGGGQGTPGRGGMSPGGIGGRRLGGGIF